MLLETETKNVLAMKSKYVESQFISYDRNTISCVDIERNLNQNSKLSTKRFELKFRIFKTMSARLESPLPIKIGSYKLCSLLYASDLEKFKIDR